MPITVYTVYTLIHTYITYTPYPLHFLSHIYILVCIFVKIYNLKFMTIRADPIHINGVTVIVSIRCVEFYSSNNTLQSSK